MLDRVSLAHLKYFVDAAHLKSITKAAEKNYVSQSAVSQALSNLERLTKRRLITHHRNRFQLSPEGSLLLRLLTPILENLHEVDTLFCGQSFFPEGEIHVACPRSIALAVLGPKLQSIKKKYPKLIPRLSMYTPDIVKEKLLSHDIEVAFLIDNVDLSPFETFLIHSGHFGVFQKEVPENLQNMPIIFTEPRREVNLFKKAYEEHFQQPLHPYLEVTSWDVIARFANEGIAAGFVPDYVIQSFPGLKKVSLPLPKIPYHIYATVRNSRHLSRNAQAFLSFFMDT